MGQSLVKPPGAATPELESAGVMVPKFTGPLPPAVRRHLVADGLRRG